MAQVTLPCHAATAEFSVIKELRAWMAKEHTRALLYSCGFTRKTLVFHRSRMPRRSTRRCVSVGSMRQKLPFDADSWVQKFTPRRAKGRWSKINVGHVDRLIQEGQMTPAGLKEG